MKVKEESEKVGLKLNIQKIFISRIPRNRNKGEAENKWINQSL